MRPSWHIIGFTEWKIEDVWSILVRTHSVLLVWDQLSSLAKDQALKQGPKVGGWTEMVLTIISLNIWYLSFLIPVVLACVSIYVKTCYQHSLNKDNYDRSAVDVVSMFLHSFVKNWLINSLFVTSTGFSSHVQWLWERKRQGEEERQAISSLCEQQSG